ncbi:MAG: Gfo/Idh/MocA family oxidoreductase [Oscillospiraceae bacterium]|nr:Gfo/Idh/MocA family oxidoreductase [Oscillospiraceae bacterium]
MIRLGVIGLGSIFPTQLQALKQTQEIYQLLAVCDTDINKRGKFLAELLPEQKNRINIYQNSEELFQDPNIDAVLIATPPATHFALACTGIKQKKNILLEKPATMSFGELETLYQEAKLHNVILHIAYHAAFARDVEWFLKNKDLLRQNFGLDELCRVECGFYDPYMENRNVIEQKRALGGSFLDSGVNALSVCSRLTTLSDFTLVKQDDQTDGTTIYHAEHQYQSRDCTILIRTGWDLGRNYKSTSLKFSNSNGRLLLNHSNQCVIWMQGDKEEILYQDDSLPRLVAHYTGVFTDFHHACLTREANQDQSLQVHRLLFEKIQ